jgi:hypothetical protein
VCVKHEPNHIAQGVAEMQKRLICLLFCLCKAKAWSLSGRECTSQTGTRYCYRPMKPNICFVWKPLAPAVSWCVFVVFHETRWW